MIVPGIKPSGVTRATELWIVKNLKKTNEARGLEITVQNRSLYEHLKLYMLQFELKHSTQ